MIPVRKLPAIPADSLTLRRGLGLDFDIVAAEVDQGAAECWYFDGYGYAITRMEYHPASDTRTLVIVGTGLTHKVQSAYRDIFPLIEDAAKTNGCDFIRAHCNNKPMGRYLESLGFEYKGSEYGRALK